MLVYKQHLLFNMHGMNIKEPKNTLCSEKWRIFSSKVEVTESNANDKS